MSNEQSPNENQAPVSQPDAATTPIDLASAFKALNQINREAAEEPVAAGEDAGQSGDESTISNNGANQEGGEGEDDESTSVASGSEDTGNIGGSSDGIEAIDFNAYKQGMLRDIQRTALQQVQREFNEQNIGYYSIAELQVRDEQSGRVRYRNPDVQDERDPDYYFKSRTDAQNFCESWNKGVDFEYRKAVNEKQRELVQQEAPKARLIDFMPKWKAMSEPAKKVFDTLLEGHEIRDASGKEIGFNVNLEAVAAQAEKIASSFQSAGKQGDEGSQQSSATPGANKSNGPAMDMPTGNGSSADEKEPSNIGEALKMFDKKNKGGK